MQFMIFRQGIALAGRAEHLAHILNISIKDLKIWAEANQLAPTSAPFEIKPSLWSQRTYRVSVSKFG
ncbi:MAG TPA: hypothetical protein VET51_01550 [Burkholderiales bacterium]|nr:hypothetical protein [Burkholderiales bacterium]